MLSVKQRSIKYHFLSLWYDSIWDWTPVSRTIGEHFTDYANDHTKEKLTITKCRWYGIYAIQTWMIYAITNTEHSLFMNITNDLDR